VNDSGRTAKTTKASTKGLAPEDEALVEAARDAIRKRYQPGRHHIGAAVRTAAGKVYTAVHLDTYVGRASVCAEAIALGRALLDDDTPVVAVASVRHPRPTESSQTIGIVAPCGICREMLADFAPGCRVVVPDEQGAHTRTIEALLPNKYRRPS
jgi:cytidine deaminase